MTAKLNESALILGGAGTPNMPLPHFFSIWTPLLYICDIQLYCDELFCNFLGIFIHQVRSRARVCQASKFSTWKSNACVLLGLIQKPKKCFGNGQSTKTKFITQSPNCFNFCKHQYPTFHPSELEETRHFCLNNMY